MGWLTDIVVSRLLAQQGTTGGTSRAVTRPAARRRLGSVHGPWMSSHRRRWPLASPAPRWAHSFGRHAPRQRLEPGDTSSAETAKKIARKVCAQLAHSIPLISEWLRLLSIERRPKVAAGPANRGPYSLIFFGTGGSGAGFSITGGIIARRCIRQCANWIGRWPAGPIGNTRSCAAICAGRCTGLRAFPGVTQDCLRTGRWAYGVAPWREPYERRRSRTVLRERRGETPRRYSPRGSRSRAGSGDASGGRSPDETSEVGDER